MSADNSAACRQVGVNRKTGTRWRYGRSIPAAGGGLLHYPPVITPDTSIVSPRYLSQDERVVIADLHRAGLAAPALPTDHPASPTPTRLVVQESPSRCGRGRR